MQGMLPPRRMRFSLESRCRFVRLVVERQWSPESAAAACGAHRSTGYRWLARFERGGWAGLCDQPSVPRTQPRRLSAAAESEIVAVRQATKAGPVVIAAILKSLEIATREPERRTQLWKNADYFHAQLQSLGIDTGAPAAPRFGRPSLPPSRGQHIDASDFPRGHQYATSGTRVDEEN